MVTKAKINIVTERGIFFSLFASGFSAVSESMAPKLHKTYIL
jgi:hypothetical protein